MPPRSVQDREDDIDLPPRLAGCEVSVEISSALRVSATGVPAPTSGKFPSEPMEKSAASGWITQ
ncbi:MAG: hypothetical protein R2709_09200 [Marmoricola sp.]